MFVLNYLQACLVSFVQCNTVTVTNSVNVEKKRRKKMDKKKRFGLPVMQSRAALAAASSALDIGPKEKALYLKKSVKDAPAQAGESDSTTIGGNSQASLRSWLRQVSLNAVLVPPLKLLCYCICPRPRCLSGLLACRRHVFDS